MPVSLIYYFSYYHELLTNYEWINLFTEHLGQIRAASGNLICVKRLKCKKNVEL